MLARRRPSRLRATMSSERGSAWRGVECYHRRMKVKSAVKAGALNTYFSKVTGEKQGAFKGG